MKSIIPKKGQVWNLKTTSRYPNEAVRIVEVKGLELDLVWKSSGRWEERAGPAGWTISELLKEFVLDEAVSIREILSRYDD